MLTIKKKKNMETNPRKPHPHLLWESPFGGGGAVLP